MKLIIGLGNPGDEYALTRHNIGFMTIDCLAKELNVTFKTNKSLQGMIASYNNMGNKVILLKPLTFMNLSGEAVIATMNFYKISKEDIIVIHDDLDLPVGKTRYRVKGSAGGHNGIKSIIACVKSEEFNRVKIGIDHDKVIPVVDYVLGKFRLEEKTLVDLAINKVANGLKKFIENPKFDLSSEINN